MFKLTAVKSIRPNLIKAVSMKRDTTISALFHGIISSNVSFVTDMERADLADFDSTLRVLLPIAWDAKAEKYGFSAKKADDSADKLALDIHEMRRNYKDGDAVQRENLIEQFYQAVMAYDGANRKAVKEKELTADELSMQLLGKVKLIVTKAKESGIKDETILDMLAGMGVNVTGYVPVLERAVKPANAA